MVKNNKFFKHIDREMEKQLTPKYKAFMKWLHENKGAAKEDIREMLTFICGRK
jgi:hypothetical protein